MLQESGSRSRPHIQPQHNQWTWERFCREEAKETASAFLEKVRRFKSRHTTAGDVHDSTFTNEFSAAFLEESSILMAGENSAPQPTANGISRLEQQQQASSNKNSTGKAWWNGIFKWSTKSTKSRRSRERHSSPGSSGSNSPIPNRQNAVGSTRRKKRNIRVLKENSSVQLLNLSECEDRDDINWSSCKLMLVEQQDNYQVEIYCPPKNPMPKMSVFCLMIDEVRSTTHLEIPDSNSCFAIKSQNHGEYVFDVKTDVLKQEWVKAIQEHSGGSTPVVSNGHLPSASPTNLRASSSTEVSSRAAAPTPSLPPPAAVTPMDSSPLLIRQVHNINTPLAAPENNPARPSGAVVDVENSTYRHFSIPDRPRNRSFTTTTATSTRGVVSGDSEESIVMVDMTSFMRNYSLNRSPNRQHKTMSMFVDPNLQVSQPNLQVSQPNPYVQSYNSNTQVSLPPPPPPPSSSSCAISQSPPSRFPYGSPHGSTPPPLPKRGPTRGRSLYNSRPNYVSVANGVAPNAAASTSEHPSNHNATSMPSKAQSPSLFHIGTTALKSSSNVSSAPEDAGNSSKERSTNIPRRDIPRRDFSRETTSTLSPLCIANDPPGSLHDPPSPGNLEACSQSSSSSALHPVSIAALAKQRRGSAPFSPTEEKSLCTQGGSDSPPKERVRKISAPSILTLGVIDGGDVSTRNGTGRLTPSASYEDYTVMSPIVNDKSTDTKISASVGSEANTDKEAGSETGRETGSGVIKGKELNLDTAQENTIETAEKCTPQVSPLTSDHLSKLRHGFSEDEERSNHVTLTFPYFPQRSSPAQLQTTSTSPRLGTLNSDQGVEERRSSPLASDNNNTITDISEDIAEEEVRRHHNQASGGAVAIVESPPALIPAIRDGTTSRGSNHTNISNRSYSSMDDISATNSHPIFVETTESQGYNQASQHTHHPYEYWATNQQDIANMRTLSQYPWFHGMISRNNASQLVAGDGGGEGGVDGTGQFLVRQSESREGDFVLTFNYHNRAKHLRMTVDNEGCNIQHLWFDSVPSMLDYFKINSIPLETFWLNDDVKLTTYVHREASNAFRTTTILNIDQLNRVPPRRSRSLHLGNVHSIMNASSHPNTPSPLAIENRRGGATSSSSSTNSLPQGRNNTTGWRHIFRSQRSSSAGNVGRIQRSHSHNAGSIQATGRGGGVQRSNHENSYVWRNY